MGYDIFITRDLEWYHAARCPIGLAEWRAAVAGLRWYPPDCAELPDGTALWYHAGAVSAKHPSDAAIAAMLSLAAELDAWVVGEELEVYTPDGPVEVPLAPGHRLAPVRAADWPAVALRRPGFTLSERVPARLPSGVRWVACPPVVLWSASVPFHHDPGDGSVELRTDDPAAVRAAAELAADLGASLAPDGG
ncbi:hypothetical protein KZZ52_39410 [Dactylosporangium sp. AC04546]|uniref:hypothetical protein n=1 Tax=Dactylosporangium sp. AC04546 TaxID=2862460 RepID=UPI001EDEB601|nr:hypothetical protein [Dactylosporangium sp. AC04546]WVK80018.1 hypothetical protein KZZ52_39410 [Dactylosporangium sp. AC04546]